MHIKFEAIFFKIQLILLFGFLGSIASDLQNLRCPQINLKKIVSNFNFDFNF